jgi:hypothetical protein
MEYCLTFSTFLEPSSTLSVYVQLKATPFVRRCDLGEDSVALELGHTISAWLPGRVNAGHYLLRVQRIVLRVGHIEENGSWNFIRIVLVQADAVNFA